MDIPRAEHQLQLAFLQHVASSARIRHSAEFQTNAWSFLRDLPTSKGVMDSSTISPRAIWNSRFTVAGSKLLSREIVLPISSNAF
jgi:hypothetical protein